MNKRTLTILLASAITCASAVAQNSYDDLYYSPSKAAKEKQKKEAQLRLQQAEAYRSQAAQYTDSYSAGSSMPLTVDVDTYNRRSESGSTAIDTTINQSGDFSYTRRLERFHNPEIVAESGDNDLIEYYYSSAASQPEVNIYLVDNNPYSWGWNSWGWNSPYYPWRYSWPSWSFGWGYDPWFDVSFGWGSPWYGPSWGWSWGWNHGPGWAPRPPQGPGFQPGPGGHPGSGWAVNSPGASRPHRPYSGASSSAGKRPNYGSRPGAVNSWNSYNQQNTPSSRPGNMSNGTNRPSTGSTVNTRPSTPTHNQGTNTSPTNRDRRGSSPTYHNNSSSNRNSTPSYRPSSSGSRSYGGGGGGSRSYGGGGGGRGRR